MTSSDKIAQTNHTTATDPVVIPEDTRVVVNGTVYVAEDAGSDVAGRHIDIFMESHSNALNFGVQYTEICLMD